MPVTVKDNGWSVLKARLDKARPRVRVGIFGEAAAAKANDAKGATVGQIANAHEHGIGVPERSWMRGTVDANQKDILDGLRRAARAALNPKAPPGLEIRMLEQTGLHIAGLMRQRISSGISPALSPRYLLRKLKKYPGATTPLIASGQMWGSIGHMVEGAPSVVKAQRAAARKAAKKALATRRRNRKIARAQRKLSRVGKKVSRFANRKVRMTSRQAKRIVRSTRRTGKGLLRDAKRLARRARRSFR